jgi:hypothetical protein
VAVGIIEDVEQAAVDHRIENFGKVFQDQSVHEQEGRRQAPLRSLMLRSVDRLGQKSMPVTICPLLTRKSVISQRFFGITFAFNLFSLHRLASITTYVQPLYLPTHSGKGGRK